MNVFRKTKKSSLTAWVILLSIAIVIAQGVKLHIHALNHEHGQLENQVQIEASVKHSHIHTAHISNYDSHADGHDQTVSEMDATPTGLLGKIVNLLILFAVITTAFLLPKVNISQYTFRYRLEDLQRISWRYRISPPLRAPPL